MVAERLALGTAQLGLAYGVANRAGQVSPADAAAILAVAEAHGIDMIDTAIAYGDSEQRLGEIGVGRWKVVSKLPAVPPACENIAQWAQTTVEGSLERLRLESLYGLLLHRPQQLHGPHGESLRDALMGLRQQGLVAKIGVSVYDPGELDSLTRKLQLDLVQAPFNVFDRRLEASGWLMRLHEAGIEIHVRSVFLQGLLLMDDAVRPGQFEKWRPLWNEWYRWLETQSLTPLQACLGFVLAHTRVDRAVVGVDSVVQLQQVLTHAESGGPLPPDCLVSQDQELINPARWRAV